MEKEFLIDKISDQKESHYSFYRNLDVDEIGMPISEEIDKMVSLEKGKNVAFLVFEDIIKLISFKNERVFKSKVMKECKDAMLDDTFIGFKLSTTPENAEKINNKVYELKEEELNRNGLKRR